MLNITIKIIAILAMIVFMFIGIWGFILLIKIFNQLRYKNYLMEKLTQNIYRLSLSPEKKEDTNTESEVKDSLDNCKKELLET